MTAEIAHNVTDAKTQDGNYEEGDNSMNKVDAVREETMRNLGGGIDVSYITQGLIEEIGNAEKFAQAGHWVAQGTSITVNNGTWYFKLQCSEQWRSWPSQLDFTAIDECPNGRQLFKIWPR